MTSERVSLPPWAWFVGVGLLYLKGRQTGVDVCVRGRCAHNVKKGVLFRVGLSCV